ncbi:MAG TPA: hypothetical protein VIL69_24645 [Roseomonas sp.]|jgi:hypothetical protein
MFPSLPDLLCIEPCSASLRDRISWGSGSNADPQVAPTPNEIGLPDHKAKICWGLIGRCNLQEHIRCWINAAVNAGLQGGILARSLANKGALPRPPSLQECDDFLRADLVQCLFGNPAWRPVNRA